MLLQAPGQNTGLYPVIKAISEDEDLHLQLIAAECTIPRVWFDFLKR